MDTASILIPIRDKITQTFTYLHIVICIVTECMKNGHVRQPSFNRINIGNYILRRRSSATNSYRCTIWVRRNSYSTPVSIWGRAHYGI